MRINPALRADGYWESAEPFVDPLQEPDVLTVQVGPRRWRHWRSGAVCRSQMGLILLRQERLLCRLGRG